MTGVLAPHTPPAATSPGLLSWLAAVPVASLLLERESLGLVAGNAEAVALLEAAPEHSGAAWRSVLVATPGLRRYLAAATAGPAAATFEARLDRPGRPGRMVLVRARQVMIEARPLVSANLMELPAGPPQSQPQGRPGGHRPAEPVLTRTAGLRALFDANPIATHRSHADGRVLDANAAFLRLIGASRAALEAGTLRWDALTPPELVPLDVAARDEAMANGHCAPYEKEYLLPDGRRVPVLVGFAVLNRSGSEFAAFVLDLTAQKQAEAHRISNEREARRRLADFEALYRTTPLDLAQLDRNLRYVRVNEAMAAMNGFPAEAHIGRSAWDLVPDLRAAAEPFLRRVLETGEAMVGLEFSGETLKEPGRRRDWLGHFHPVHDPETWEVVGVGVVCEEVTDRREAERARELLLRELDHRVKNLFAVVGGLVTFTARTAATPEAMRGTLLGRIGALGRAHDLVRPALVGAAVGQPTAQATARAAGPTLALLLEALLEPFRAGRGEQERLRLDGPPVPLGQTGAPPLALALHELATNAAKHDALTGDAGLVSIEWAVLPMEPGPSSTGPNLLLRWQERGGPAVGAPSRGGFGRGGFGQRLIAQSCAQLGGTARIAWHADGLVAELLLPLSRLVR